MRSAFILVASLIPLQAWSVSIFSVVRCPELTRHFRLDEENLVFGSFKLIKGHRIVLESRQPGQGLEIDCRKGARDQSQDGPWERVRQESAPQTWAQWGKSFFTSKPKVSIPVELSNKNEFPVRTKVRLLPEGGGAEIWNSAEGRAVRIECLPTGVNLFIKDLAGVEKQVLAISEDQSAPAGGKTCGETDFRLDLKAKKALAARPPSATHPAVTAPALPERGPAPRPRPNNEGGRR